MSERPIEQCCVCDDATGRAGRSEDSLYTTETDKGPFCESCYRGAQYIDDELRAALARAEKAEAQLCRAREAMTSRPSDNAPLASDVLGFRVAEAIAALSSSAPCPHEAEVERLVDMMVRLLKSSDVSWYSGKHGGHDWREAVDEAHLLLVKVDRRAGGPA